MPALPFAFEGQKRLVASEQSRAEGEGLLAVRGGPLWKGHCTELD